MLCEQLKFWNDCNTCERYFAEYEISDDVIHTDLINTLNDVSACKINPLSMEIYSIFTCFAKTV